MDTIVQQQQEDVEQDAVFQSSQITLTPEEMVFCQLQNCAPLEHFIFLRLFAIACTRYLTHCITFCPWSLSNPK